MQKLAERVKLYAVLLPSLSLAELSLVMILLTPSRGGGDTEILKYFKIFRGTVSHAAENK